MCIVTEFSAGLGWAALAVEGSESRSPLQGLSERLCPAAGLTVGGGVSHPPGCVIAVLPRCSRLCFPCFQLAQGQPWSENIKRKIPEINNSSVVNHSPFWCAWWNLVPPGRESPLCPACPSSWSLSGHWVIRSPVMSPWSRVQWLWFYLTDNSPNMQRSGAGNSHTARKCHKVLPWVRTWTFIT